MQEQLFVVARRKFKYGTYFFCSLVVFCREKKSNLTFLLNCLKGEKRMSNAKKRTGNQKKKERKKKRTLYHRGGLSREFSSHFSLALFNFLFSFLIYICIFNYGVSQWMSFGKRCKHYLRDGISVPFLWWLSLQKPTAKQKYFKTLLTFIHSTILFDELRFKCWQFSVRASVSQSRLARQPNHSFRCFGRAINI